MIMISSKLIRMSRVLNHACSPSLILCYRSQERQDLLQRCLQYRSSDLHYTNQSVKIKYQKQIIQNKWHKAQPSKGNVQNVNCTDLIAQSTCHTRDERDFGLETETETRVVSRSVSSFETTSQNSQYQSQNFRLITKVSV